MIAPDSPAPSYIHWQKPDKVLVPAVLLDCPQNLKLTALCPVSTLIRPVDYLPVGRHPGAILNHVALADFPGLIPHRRYVCPIGICAVFADFQAQKDALCQRTSAI